jgi:ATP-dependent RNA/DNA helicase IGHMBP2
MDPHLQRLHDALSREESAERAEHARLMRLDIEGQIAAGVRWPTLQIVEQGGRTRRGVRLTLEGPALHDGIRPGDRITLSCGEHAAEGYCEDVGAHRAWVRADRWPDEVDGAVSVVRAFDPTTFIRFRQALERADEARGRLKSVLLGRIDPGGVDAPPVDWPELNPGQQRAAGMALAADPLALVHGPPGTGKTTLIARLLVRLVEDGDRPWALASSNAATDHLALSAAARGLDVVRLGRPERVRRDARHLSLDHRVASGPLAAALKALDRDIDRALIAGAPRSELGALYDERRTLERRAQAHAVESAQVIAATLGTLARVGPDLPPATWAVVDEATQAVEPAIWGAVPHVKRLVLVGDPEQLGPVVKSGDEVLSRSLLERLLAEAPVTMPMLDVQHRMHVEIQGLVSHIYGERYHAHADVRAHRLCDLPGVAGDELTSASALWIDTAGAGLDEARDPVTRSLYNEGEIAVLAIALRDLRAAGVAPEHIGVIAAYSAQVTRLREHPDFEGVEVSTVDGFQGREKEVILCSFVRSGAAGEVGFLEDRRRLTVALTRARRLWLGVGDSGTLERARAFAPVLERLEATGGWRTVWEPPWDEAVGV